MIGHVTSKLIIKLKSRKCFFKPLIKGNVKYTKTLHFLLIFMVSLYFVLLCSDSA